MGIWSTRISAGEETSPSRSREHRLKCKLTTACPWRAASVESITYRMPVVAAVSGIAGTCAIGRRKRQIGREPITGVPGRRAAPLTVEHDSGG